MGALTGDTNRAVLLDGANDNIIRSPITGVGTTAISTDFWMKSSNTKASGIVSYAASSSADEFQLRDPKALAVYVKGTRYNTNVKLNDGVWHHVAVTWASAAGALRVYKDGALAFSNASPVKQGATITAGGALVLGQEQDSVGGGFETSQAYLGNLDEVALYPTALSAARVSAHRQAGITSGCPTGLAATAAKTVALPADALSGPHMFEGSEFLPNLAPGTGEAVADTVAIAEHRPAFCPLGEA